MVKRLTTDALLLAIALVMFVFEAQLPPIVPVPGVKLGLANIITVYAFFVLTPQDAFLILVCRIFLGSVFSGQLMTFFFSFAGGMLCFLSLLCIKPALTSDQIWVASVISAIFHNIGQIIMAIIIFSSPAMMAYLPVLIFSGTIAGLLTGLSAQVIINRLNHKKTNL
ncbi:MAG: Gx transporter family protein [Erysipelotrichaceae bacterium]|nr:Gx transporter family protein [Erysipelotrichaceae bacterium]